MNNLDIILLAIVLIPGLWMGISKGFIHQAISIIALFAGAAASYKFASLLGQALQSWLNLNGNMLYIISFAIILVVTFYLFSILGKLLEKIIKDIFGPWVNTIFGILFGVVKTALFVGIAICLFNEINTKTGLIPNEKLNASKVYGFLRETTDFVFPYIKDLLLKGRN